jgi:ribosomal protein L9
MSQMQARWGSTLKIRLLSDYESLGAKGDVVAVKAGYARNCLIPKKIATYISPTELKMMQAATAGESATTSAPVAPVTDNSP